MLALEPGVAKLRLSSKVRGTFDEPPPYLTNFARIFHGFLTNAALVREYSRCARGGERLFR